MRRPGDINPTLGLKENDMRLMMRNPRWLLAVGLATAATCVAATPSSAGTIPSGERIVGQTVLEPVYDDISGAIRYVSTPKGVPFPVKSNPIAVAPFYLPVYPVGATVGTTVCKDVPVE